MLVSNEFYWLAGLLEGEAAFVSGSPSSPNIPKIVVHMTDRDIVERVAKIFGTKVQSRRVRNPRWKPQYCTTLTGFEAVELMSLLQPQMGERRSFRIDKILKSYIPRRLLTTELIVKVFELSKQGLIQRRIAEQVGLKRSLVSMILIGSVGKRQVDRYLLLTGKPDMRMSYKGNYVALPMPS